MRRTLPFLLGLIAFIMASVCRAQPVSFILQVNNLPGMHAWDYWTDYNESGHLTESTGTQNWTIQHSFKVEYYEPTFFRSNDTLIIVQPGLRESLRIVPDSIPNHFRMIQFGYEDPELDSNYTFRIQNVDMNPADTLLECTFAGNQLLGHNLLDTLSSFFENVPSGQQTFRDVYSNNDTVLSSTTVFFSISSSIFAQASVLPNSAPSIGLYPQPAQSLLNVYYPDSLIGSRASIVDVCGKELLHTIPFSSKFQIDISTLPPGSYFLNVGNQMKKFEVIR